MTKAKPLLEDEVFGVHDRLVCAAEAAGYKFFYVGMERGKPEAFLQGSPDGPRQTALVWAIRRVQPARMRMRRAPMIEEAADREQAIRQAMLKNQCVPAANDQEFIRCLGSRRRRTPAVSPHLCDADQRSCTHKQPETEPTCTRPALQVTVNVEDLVPNLDDRLRDKGSAKARSAVAELLAAADCYGQHASKLESAFPIIDHEFPERGAANHFRLFAQWIQQVLSQVDHAHGYPDIRNPSEWQEALSDISVVLRKADCSGKEIAQWLWGRDDPDRIAAVENKVSRRRKLAR